MKLQFKRLSTVGERIGSFIIDHFILSFLFIVIIAGALSIYDGGNNFYFVIVFIMIAPLVYALKDEINGRSIGKRVFGIGVRCVENVSAIPSKWRLFLRNITLVILPIEFLIMIFNPEGTRLGDLLAKTIVVKLEKSESENVEAAEIYIAKNYARNLVSRKKVLRISLILVLILGISIVSFIGGISSLMKNNGAYKVTIAQIENSSGITSKIGEIEGYGFMPAGSVSTNNGSGEAQFVIKVKGEKGNAKVFSKLYKENNAGWRIIEFRILE